MCAAHNAEWRLLGRHNTKLIASPRVLCQVLEDVYQANGFDASAATQPEGVYMNWVRDFSNQEGHLPPARNTEDAPQPMRQELIDLFFALAEQNPGTVPEERIHRIIGQSLGAGIASQPYGGFRYAAGRDIGRAEWPRVYDLIPRLTPEFDRVGLGVEFREGVNRILAAHGSAWDIGEDGRLHRVLPAAARAMVQVAFAELSDARYIPSLALFEAARAAYDERPQRPRDACSNIFDSLESVAKIRHNLPRSTFGKVLANIEQEQQARPPQPTEGLRADTLEILRRLNDLRNHHFGHSVAFELTGAEIDFTFLTCVGGILMFVRTP